MTLHIDLSGDLITGALTGVVGAGAAYSVGVAAAGGQWTWKGFGISAGIGFVTGGIIGLLKSTHLTPFLETKETFWGVEIEYSKKCSGILSNEKIRAAVLKLAKKLNADRIEVTGADRTREVQQKLIEDRLTKTTYEKCQHGSVQGYKAADVKYFRGGVQIDTLEVAKTAVTMEEVGGIGVYKTFTHIDIRERVWWDLTTGRDYARWGW